VRLLKDDLDRRGIISKIRLSRNGNRSGGKAFSRGALYELLSNPVYIARSGTAKNATRASTSRL